MFVVSLMYCHCHCLLSAPCTAGVIVGNLNEIVFVFVSLIVEMEPKSLAVTQNGD